MCSPSILEQHQWIQLVKYFKFVAAFGSVHSSFRIYVVFCVSHFYFVGLPHILEHTTLCGSKQYPVRDPFFKMLVRSLATFMNAMTGPDYTIYPFATQNKQDYFNLMSVYLDAVFR